MPAGQRAAALIGLIAIAAAITLPLFGWSFGPLGRLWGDQLLDWAAAALILTYVVAIERRPLSSIGFRTPKILDIALAVFAGALLLLSAGHVDALIPDPLHPNVFRLGDPVLLTPLWFRVMLVTWPAVVDEVLFRGYGVERIKDLTGSGLVAGLITWTAFTLTQTRGWGAPFLLDAAFCGLVLTGLYLWRRNTWANIIAHWIGGAGILLASG